MAAVLAACDGGAGTPDAQTDTAVGESAPRILRGEATYSDTCGGAADAGAACAPGEVRVSGGLSTADPRRSVNCLLDASGTRFDIAIGEGGDRVAGTLGTGLRICGQVDGVGQPARSGTLRLYYDRTPALVVGPHAVPDACTVRNVEIRDRSVVGQFQCTDVTDDQSPPQQHTIRGATGTADPAWGEFRFDACTVVPEIGPCT